MTVAEQIRAVLAAKAEALTGRAADDLERLIDPGFVYVNVAGATFDSWAGREIDA